MASKFYEYVQELGTKYDGRYWPLDCPDNTPPATFNSVINTAESIPLYSSGTEGGGLSLIEGSTNKSLGILSSTRFDSPRTTNNSSISWYYQMNFYLDPSDSDSDDFYFVSSDDFTIGLINRNLVAGAGSLSNKLHTNMDLLKNNIEKGVTHTIGLRFEPLDTTFSTGAGYFFVYFDGKFIGEITGSSSNSSFYILRSEEINNYKSSSNSTGIPTRFVSDLIWLHSSENASTRALLLPTDYEIAKMHNLATKGIGTATISGAVSESSAATDFNIIFNNYATGEFIRSIITNDGTFSELLPDYNYAVTCYPVVGDAWSADTSVILDTKMLPSNPDVIRFYFKVVTAGITGTTEPTWNTSAIGAQTVDGTVTWELVEALTQPITHAPVRGVTS